MIGRDLLVANVIDPGASERRVYLPDNGSGWWDFWSGTWHAGGQEIAVPVTLASMPLFVRGGAVLPLAEGLNRADAARDTARVLALFPAPAGTTSTSTEYADDGLSANALAANHAITEMTLACEADALRLALRRKGAYRPAFASMRVELPSCETRRLFVNGREIASGESVAVPDA
jgi:alpha-glucosidase